MTARAEDVIVLGTDYDRTLTDLDLAVRPDTKTALQEARAAGLRVVVVSGRDSKFLLDHVGDCVDLIVSENGAFLVDPASGKEEPLFQDWPTVATLRRIGVPMEYASASANADVAHAAEIERAVREMGLPVRLERNVDRIMVLPAGVEKASGFLAALARLGVPRERAAAVGDGENDVSLLGAAGYRVAVANAVPDVRAMAHEVTRGAGGEGVAEWVRERWMRARARTVA